MRQLLLAFRSRIGFGGAVPEPLHALDHHKHNRRHDHKVQQCHQKVACWPAGNLLVALLNFVVVAAVVFVVVKSVERLRHRTAKADPAAESQKQLAQAVERLSAALEERRL